MLNLCRFRLLGDFRYVESAKPKSFVSSFVLLPVNYYSVLICIESSMQAVMPQLLYPHWHYIWHLTSDECTDTSITEMISWTLEWANLPYIMAGAINKSFPCWISMTERLYLCSCKRGCFYFKASNCFETSFRKCINYSLGLHIKLTNGVFNCALLNKPPLIGLICHKI